MSKQVTVYSKPHCIQCTKLKLWLDAKSIEYNELDITRNEEGLNKVLEAGRKSMPVLEIDGKFVDYKIYNDILEMV